MKVFTLICVCGAEIDGEVHESQSTLTERVEGLHCACGREWLVFLSKPKEKDKP